MFFLVIIASHFFVEVMIELKNVSYYYLLHIAISSEVKNIKIIFSTLNNKKLQLK
jgi:hypothetical protein